MRIKHEETRAVDDEILALSELPLESLSVAAEAIICANHIFRWEYQSGKMTLSLEEIRARCVEQR